MENYLENNPSAEVVVNSMRAMGYSFESAISDVIDNSVAAKASLIELRFPIDPIECYVAICDNGIGMSRERLIESMKYGSQTEDGTRAIDDLGRFGLGMKTASLSQCRRLTVASKYSGSISAFIWDLDVIDAKKGWYMVECTGEQISQMKHIAFLDSVESGTVVLWENFDYIDKSSGGNVYAELSRLKDSTAEYLSLIFHRFLNREGGSKVTIKVNNYVLQGLDPFLENHKKTNIRHKIDIPIEDSEGIERYVAVQPYVLPFQKDLSAEDKKLSGGIENYRSKQGFYIYRNERLIIWGTWFGRHRDELTKYARIKVDIPNTLDDIWNIDIKKQQATIPSRIKSRLTRAVDEAMDIAVKQQKHRGRLEKVNDDIDYIWDRIKGRGDNFTYKINRNSKIFELIHNSVSDDIWAQFDMVLEEIENAVPFQQIYIDKSQNKVDEEVDPERLAEIKAKAEMLLRMAMMMGGTTREAALEELLKAEPFNHYPELKDML